MRFSAIDIGTNTILLLVADIDEDGVINTVAQEQRLPRLGKNVDERKRINRQAFVNANEIIREYLGISEKLGSSTTIACATSALRDASNKNEFISFIKQETTIDIEIINGDDEALWTYRGALSGFPDISRNTAVIDIGGGSTEMSFPVPGGHNGIHGLHRFSLQLGAVRLKERYFKHDPPRPTELDSAVSFILEELSQVSNPGFGDYELIGVAGTVTTLSCLDQQLAEFDIRKVSGYKFSRQRVVDWSHKLSLMASNEVGSLSNTTSGREDILSAGVLILAESMKLFGFQSLLVSERGLRYGLILREWEKMKTR